MLYSRYRAYLGHRVGEYNLLYINETENNVRINYVEVNTCIEEDILLPTEIDNCNMVK